MKTLTVMDVKKKMRSKQNKIKKMSKKIRKEELRRDLLGSRK